MGPKQKSGENVDLFQGNWAEFFIVLYSEPPSQARAIPQMLGILAAQSL